MTRYLFDEMWSVGEQIARAERVLLCMEFDGVVAPEMEEDSLVSVSPQMQRVLWSLAGDERCVLAFLSHRSRAELQMRIGLPDVWYAGSHGLEIGGPGSVSIHRAQDLAPQCRLVSKEDFLEVRPAVSWNRASAVKLIQQHVTRPDALLVYLGTDDEGTFLSLDDGITIQVGENEGSAAQFYVSGPPDVRRFLEWVTGLNRESQALAAATSSAD
jgi:trehalose 6-phosphate phosphatase